MDEFTGFKKSFLLHVKDELVEVLIDWFNVLKSKYKVDFKYIHCDNAGENKAQHQQLKEDGLKIKFEFTAPGKLQQNGIVECAFPPLIGHTMAMMNYAGSDKNM